MRFTIVKAGAGFNITLEGGVAAYAYVNLCKGAYCPCVDKSEPSAICVCPQGYDFATLSTLKVTAMPNTFGRGLILHYDAHPRQAVHQSFVFLTCDEKEYGLRPCKSILFNRF